MPLGVLGREVLGTVLEDFGRETWSASLVLGLKRALVRKIDSLCS